MVSAGSSRLTDPANPELRLFLQKPTKVTKNPFFAVHLDRGADNLATDSICFLVKTMHKSDSEIFVFLVAFCKTAQNFLNHE
jgi:hypothetical protein